MSAYESDELDELKKLAENGDAEAQNILGARLITGQYVKQDILGGFYWYCQAIKQGYIHAKWNAGSMLVNGDDGIEKNEMLGMRLIQEAADGNENSACLFISHCYVTGSYAKEKNEVLAKVWERRAWDYKNLKLFNQPIDLEVEYDLRLDKPE